MDNEPSYHIPPNPGPDPALAPGLGRKLWLGILCIGMVLLSFMLVQDLSNRDRSDVYDLLTPLDAPPMDRATTIFYIFVVLIVVQVILEGQYLHTPSRTRHRRTITGIVLLAVCLLMIGHFFMVALTSQ